jgi:hypothetical protein
MAAWSISEMHRGCIICQGGWAGSSLPSLLLQKSSCNHKSCKLCKRGVVVLRHQECGWEVSWVTEESSHTTPRNETLDLTFGLPHSHDWCIWGRSTGIVCILCIIPTQNMHGISKLPPIPLCLTPKTKLELLESSLNGVEVLGCLCPPHVLLPPCCWALSEDVEEWGMGVWDVANNTAGTVGWRAGCVTTVRHS